MNKHCKFCDKTLSVEDFHKNKNLGDGYNNKCKSCVKEYQAKNKDRIREKEREWLDKNRDRVNERRKKYYEKTKDRQKELGKISYHKNKHITRKRYIENNKEEIKEYRRKYRLKNKEKDLNYRIKRQYNMENAGTFSMDDWNFVKELYDHKCVYCDCDIKDGATIDHFIPLSKGGLNVIENLVPACLSCNQSKHAYDPFEWYETKFNKKLILPTHIVLDAY